MVKEVLLDGGGQRSSEAEEDDGATAAAVVDGDGGKEGRSTSKSGDTEPKTQPSMDRGVAMMVTEVLLDGGGLRSFRRRRTAAAGGWDGDGGNEGRDW